MRPSRSAVASLSLALFAGMMAFTPLVTFVPGLRLVHSMPALVAYFWAAALAGGVFLRLGAFPRRSEAGAWGTSLAVSITLAGAIYIVASYTQEVSDYPLTLSWSEASRYYYASLFFSERVYGAAAQPTVLHPSRYLLQAVPFLIPGSSIWLHRAWQALLWVALPAVAAGWMARRVASPSRVRNGLLAGVFFLYLFIGPVYYHLVVPLIVILGGFSTSPGASPRRKWASLAALLAASAWAGISRINWFPVPGLLAAALILMEQPIAGGRDAPPGGTRPMLDRKVWGYFVWPVGVTLLGTATAFAAQVAYIAWSGNRAEQFASSLFSDLLWHRLLPNSTYPPGLILAAAIVSLPPALLLAGKLLAAGGVRRFHPLRLLALAAILGVLLAGGMLVSLKIGGGSNLHNLDAYMALLAVICAYFVFDRAVPDWPASGAEVAPGAGFAPAAGFAPGAGFAPASRLLQAGMLLLFAVTPTFAIFPRLPGAALPPAQATNEALEAISEAAAYAHAQGRQVLFIGERQLLTFHTLEGIPLEPDYERVFLMEAAMANDEAYLARFYDDLKNQRFGLIVSEPLSKQLKGPVDSFGAENNAWVKRVSRFVLCYYEPVKTFNPVQVQLLMPAARPAARCP